MIVDREVEHIVARIVEAVADRLAARSGSSGGARLSSPTSKEQPDGFAVLLRDAPRAKARGDMPALMYDLADRVGDVFTRQFRQRRLRREGRADLRARTGRHGRVRRPVVDGDAQAAAGRGGREPRRGARLDGAPPPAEEPALQAPARPRSRSP